MTTVRTSFSAAILIAILLSACGGSSEVDPSNPHNLITDIEAHRLMMTAIDSMEQVLYNDSLNYDAELAASLRESYDTFARRFGGDQAKCPEYLYKSAAISRGLGQPLKAIKTYDQILNKYPNYERGPEVQFLIAFTYDEDLKEINLAKDAYREVISKFANDHWAFQAEKRLETIDMTDEELMEFFLKNQGQGS